MKKKLMIILVVSVGMMLVLSATFARSGEVQDNLRFAETGVESILEEEEDNASALADPAPVRVLAVNSLGMHCYDSDFSVFSVLPLFNVINAQVIQVGAQPQILDHNQISVFYKAKKDPSGSINKTSRGKTNFWDYVEPLFGVPLSVDTGLLGARMPGPNNIPRPFLYYDPTTKWFSAEGIPITGIDDAFEVKPYPLMNVRAGQTRRGTVLYQLPVVVPASDEMACGVCHKTGGVAAKKTGIAWSKDPDAVRQYKQNILILHDAVFATDLYANQPVLCAACHYSAALDLSGQGPDSRQQQHRYLSHSVHGFHADHISQDPTSNSTCYHCHPGKHTQCLRGVMNAAGIVCISCHGSMYAVGSETRSPWVDEPKCQSCHTGDAINHKGGSIRLTVAYGNGIDTATPRIASNKRFAENNNTLYRNSLGHGDVACAFCHGSPHAEWPSLERNDNLAAKKLQGHSGKIIECPVCHGSQLSQTIDGPHGMHNVNAAVWYKDGHEDFYEQNPEGCQACHAKELNGTVLSKAAKNRKFKIEGKTISVKKGEVIGCKLCHEKPSSDS